MFVQFGGTPLHLAAEMGNENIVKLMVAYDVDLGIGDKVCINTSIALYNSYMNYRMVGQYCTVQLNKARTRWLTC